MATANKVTKKLKPIEPEAVKEIDTSKTDIVVQRLDTMIQYMERIDWKLWMMMGMIRMIGEENGYRFSFYHDPEENADQTPVEKEPKK